MHVRTVVMSKLPKMLRMERKATKIRLIMYYSQAEKKTIKKQIKDRGKIDINHKIFLQERMQAVILGKILFE